MNLRTTLGTALCSAAVLLLGCNAPNDTGHIESEMEDSRHGRVESHRAGAKFDPSARHFVRYGQPIFATEMHKDYVEDFLSQPGAGFGRMVFRIMPNSAWVELVAVRSSERSLGGDHAGNGPIQYDQVTETLTLSDGTRLERREQVWLLQDRQLVSVNAEAGPAAYLNSPKNQHELMKPKPSGATAPKRPLDEFEKEALEKLKAGDDVALRSSKHELRMFGAIRARLDCLTCHKVEVGTLLGAFTYTLKAQSEETPAAHRLTDKDGLTDQQLWAVRSIEAVGGKVIRTPGGPVTEVRMTFARNQETEAQLGPPAKVGTPSTQLQYRDSLGIPSTRLQLRDSALPHLLAFPELTVLDVSDSFVSDAGLKTIAELKNLKWLDLRRTYSTPEGIAELKKALPKCEVIEGPLLP